MLEGQERAKRVKLERDEAVEDAQEEGQYSALFIDKLQSKLPGRSRQRKKDANKNSHSWLRDKLQSKPPRRPRDKQQSKLRACRRNRRSQRDMQLSKC